jgi:non-specific serine/threonine protein kinase
MSTQSKRKAIGDSRLGRHREKCKFNNLQTFKNIYVFVEPQTVTGADALKRSTTSEESLFLLQNDYWIIRYQGRAAFLKSTRGLGCLAVLLREPGREFHVSELIERLAIVSTEVVGNGGVTTGLCGGIPVLDAQAKAQYKRRINELRQDLNEAERLNNPERKTTIQTELQVIADNLASAVGLGGRDRKSSCDTERARSAVTKCIKQAIKRIREAIPSLGYHLVARIKTGYFCSYNPHPERPVSWTF